MRRSRKGWWTGAGTTLRKMLSLHVTVTSLVCRWELLEQACQLWHVMLLLDPNYDSRLHVGCRWQLLEDACQPRHGKLSQEERKARRDVLNKRRLEAAVAAGGEAVLTSRNAKLLSVDVPADDSDAEDDDSDIGRLLVHIYRQCQMHLEARLTRTVTTCGLSYADSACCLCS